jgi:transposase-like protein
MQCPYPNCGSDRSIKNGFSGYKHNNERPSNRKQRYLCLECDRNYSLPFVSSIVYKSWGHPESTRKRALKLYYHSRKNEDKKRHLSYRKTAELINKKLPEGARKISHGTVRNWVLDIFQEDKVRIQGNLC